MSRTFGKSLARRPWISVPGRLISWGADTLALSLLYPDRFASAAGELVEIATHLFERKGEAEHPFDIVIRQ